MRHPLTRFVVIVLAWLPCASRSGISRAAADAADRNGWRSPCTKLGFGDIIIDVEKSGSCSRSSRTCGRPARRLSPAEGGRRRRFEVADLHLRAAAVRRADAGGTGLRDGERLAKVLAIGYLALLPFQTWGVIADALKQLRSRWVRRSHRRPASRRSSAK
jgi:hypothetical protein